MKKFICIIIIALIFVVSGCSSKTTKTNNNDEETIKLNKIQEAIYMVNYPAKQGQLITDNLALPTSYNGVSITWETINYPEIISSTGVVTRPNTCWIDSRDQQGVVKFPKINNDWPVVLQATFAYQGMTDIHKLLVVVKPIDGFTCDKYLG